MHIFIGRHLPASTHEVIMFRPNPVYLVISVLYVGMIMNVSAYLAHQK